MENTDAYNSLAEIVIDYAKKQNNYDKAYQDLSNMYAKEYQNYKGEEFTSRINQELVADVLGEKLGNQEFINHLVSSNTQTANGVYNWVVDKLNKLNKLTGYKFEKLYWTDVKNKFENAFNSNFNNYTSDIKYSINNIADYDEIEYNSQKNIKLSKQNYGILAHAISSDSNITSGVNEVELFDYEADKYVKYTIYYKDNLNWKVVDRQYDGGRDYYGREENRSSSNRTSEENSIRNEKSGSRQTNSQWNNGKIKNGSSAKRNVGISNFNQEQDSIETRSNRKIIRDSRNKSELDQSSSFLSNEFDNKGRKLSQQQQEYFKDSKVRDENGNLLTVYHGTDYGGFMTFDGRDTNGYRFNNDIVNFFTTSEEMAKTYTNDYEKVNTSKTALSVEGIKRYLKNIYDTWGNEITLKENNGKYTLTTDEGYVKLGTYNNLNDLSDNFKQDIENYFGFGDTFGGIYEAYVDIKNPLIVEGNNANWNELINPITGEVILLY